MEQHIDQLIVKVLNREASSEEIIRFSQWLSEKEENKKEFRKLKSYWDAEISFKHTLQPELSLQRTERKIQDEQRKQGRKARLFYRYSVAASIVILLGIGSFFLHEQRIKEQAPVEYFTYLTEDNKTNFTLSDGTKIFLNKNSKLVFTNRYDEEERAVRLEGEAYFEVEHNKEKPFVVEMGDARIQVLGTSFNVKRDLDNIYATLTEGSIRFEAPSQQIILSPNQQLVYTNGSHQIAVFSADIDTELAWMEGLIRHKNRLFSDIISGLEKRFGVKIVIHNEKLKNSSLSMTGTFAEDQSLEDILKVISISYPFTWEKKENIYYIK